MRSTVVGRIQYFSSMTVSQGKTEITMPRALCYVTASMETTLKTAGFNALSHITVLGTEARFCSREQKRAIQPRVQLRNRKASTPSVLPHTLSAGSSWGQPPWLFLHGAKA